MNFEYPQNALTEKAAQPVGSAAFLFYETSRVMYFPPLLFICVSSVSVGLPGFFLSTLLSCIRLFAVHCLLDDINRPSLGLSIVLGQILPQDPYSQQLDSREHQYQACQRRKTGNRISPQNRLESMKIKKPTTEDMIRGLLEKAMIPSKAYIMSFQKFHFDVPLALSSTL